MKFYKHISITDDLHDSLSDTSYIQTSVKLSVPFWNSSTRYSVSPVIFIVYYGCHLFWCLILSSSGQMSEFHVRTL